MLTEAQLAQFKDDGFLVVENVLDEDALNAVEDAFSSRLDELAAYLDVTFPVGPLTLNDKMLALEEVHPGACLIFTHSHIPSPALIALWGSGPLLDIAATLLGPDIDGHPFLAVRPKPPGVSLFTVPWHQDSAYLENGAQSVPQISVWIPLMDATRSNGCMEFARGAHRSGKELRHVSQDYIEHGNNAWYLEIPRQEASTFDVVTCEVSRGSCIVFSHLAPHRSLPNLSATCRWSLDLRYLPAGQFAGTQQAPIPFRRGLPNEAAWAEHQKDTYLNRQLSRDRTAWRHKVDTAPWKERWLRDAGKVLAPSE